MTVESVCGKTQPSRHRCRSVDQSTCRSVHCAPCTATIVIGRSATFLPSATDSRISRTCYSLCILDRRRPTRFIIHRKRVFFTADRHFGLIISRLVRVTLAFSPVAQYTNYFIDQSSNACFQQYDRAHEYYERNK